MFSMFVFTQAAYILLDSVPKAEKIEAILDEQGFSAVKHHGIDLLTKATDSVVFEVVLRPERRVSLLVDVIDGRWPDTIPDSKEDPVTFVSWHAAAYGRFAYPGCLKRALQECRTWPGAEKAVSRHKALLRLRMAYERGSDGLRDGWRLPGDFQPFDELVLLTRLLLALDRLPGVLGYFFPGGEALHSRELLFATWDEYISRGRKPFDLWILWINRRLGRVEELPDWAVIDIVGLHQLEVTDIEACFQHTRYQPLQVANWLFNVASYLYDNGPIIQDGHTLTGPGGINWQAHNFESSLQFPPRTVLCLRPLDGTTVPPRFLKRLPVPKVKERD
jgi:hypothetical protein